MFLPIWALVVIIYVVGIVVAWLGIELLNGTSHSVSFSLSRVSWGWPVAIFLMLIMLIGDFADWLFFSIFYSQRK
jgi:hypothetical protein